MSENDKRKADIEIYERMIVSIQDFSAGRTGWRSGHLRPRCRPCHWG